MYKGVNGNVLYYVLMTCLNSATPTQHVDHGKIDLPSPYLTVHFRF